MARVKARKERQKLIRRRKRAVIRIQIYFKYYKWALEFWAERYLEYITKKLSMRLQLRHFLDKLKLTAQKSKQRKEAARTIWRMYTYLKWR